MITKPTVFVLGAGASMPYGFPSGANLVKEICGATAGTEFNDIQPGLLEKGQVTKIMHDIFGESYTEEFGKALYYSQRYSIDAFLERRPRFADIGKFAISLFILRKEISANLFSFENQDKGCYKYLFDKLDARWEDLDKNKVSFITFNYDRSLEHFLFTTFRNTYEKSESECAKVVGSIPIIHVHGSLGKLPWQATDGIAYSGFIESHTERNEKGAIANGAASSASKQIKVIPENQSGSEGFEEASKLLSKADRAYFLGFGYHSDNLERLGLTPFYRFIHEDGSRYYTRFGTAYGMETGEIEVVKDKWSIGLPDNTSDSLLFLRKYAVLD